VVDCRVGLGDELAEGVVDAVVGDRGGGRAGVVLGQVSHRAEVVGEGPEDGAGRGEVGDLLVGQDLVHRRAPEVAVGELGRPLGVVVELEDVLAALVQGDRAAVEGYCPRWRPVMGSCVAKI